MGMQGSSAGAIALGVVLVIVGIVTIEAGGAWLIVQGAILIAGGAVGLAFEPKAASPQGAKARQLELATASEGFPIPVVFGEQKIVGNFMQYRKEHFRSVKIYGQPASAGGKGGGTDAPKGVVGFDYYLQFEYALCMGPVDSCMQVWSSPGEIAMRPTSPLVEAPFAPGQEYIELTLKAKQEGGLIRLWRGSATQTRVNPNGSDKYVQDYLESVSVLTGGAAYGPNTKATVTGDGTGAEVKVIRDSGAIVAVKILKRGYNYTNAAIVLSTTGGGAGATFKVNIGGGTMNYRNICYVLFGPGNGFKIGRFPQPKSYAFVIRRLPVVKRDNGTAIAGFQVRGSLDATKPGYYQANPAAMVYEIMTNKLWGRGLSSDLINETSFVEASEYFKSRHIGISYTLDGANKITELIDILRTHLRTVLVWDGERLKMRVLMNPAETKETILTLDEGVVSELQFSRPDWTNTFNELRAEFNNAQRNYRPDVIHIMDAANIALVGGRINPIRIQLPAFTDFNIAWKQCHRMLREYTYPLATASFQMNMFKSRCEVGDTFRLIWSEYGAGFQTSYFNILKKTEAGQGSENVKIVALEDVDISPVEGKETIVAVPDKQPWELLPDLDVSRVGLFIVPGTVNDAIDPVTAFELSAVFTKGKVKTIFLGEKGNDGITGFAIYWKQDQPNFGFFENYDSFAITGVLITAIDDVEPFDRKSEGAFDFAINNPDRNEGDLLGSANLVSLESDDLETLLDSGRCMMFIEDECILIGNVEKIGENQFRAYNIIRGAIGTPIAIHAAGTNLFYVDEMPLAVQDGRLVPNKETQFTVNPIGTNGETETGTPFYIFHTGNKNQKFLGIGNRPLSPIPIEIKDSTDLDFPGKQITLRPRNYHKGADTGPFYQVIKDLIPNAETMDFSMQQLDVNGNFCVDPELIPWEVARIIGGHAPANKPAAARVERIPDYVQDTRGGTITFYGIQLEPDCVEIRVFAVLTGLQSVEYASFYP